LDLSRNIPIALQSHLDQQSTTTCRLLQIKPAREPVFGYSSTNRPITFDASDGYGEITYQVMSGFDHSAVVSTGDVAVDNTDGRVLYLSGGPITEANINAGVYDGAEFTILAVNYLDLTAGRCYVVMHGYIGRIRVVRAGLFQLELRSLIDVLRQEPWEKWQIYCRVKRFQSIPGEERFPCNYTTNEWVTGVAVTSVSVESNRTFTASGLAQSADYFAPGMVLWTSGPNAGLSFEVEEFGTGGVISLLFPTPYPITAGDDFDIRRDCTRAWSGHNSCETYDNRENFRGEPKIKPAEALVVSIPGASVGPGSGGDTYQPDPESEGA
jgi:uncharacterized phage protein (TIGR02218 family)